MKELQTLTYEVTGAIARITLNRPERGNGITLEMPAELASCVEAADLNPDVRVIALSGRGKGFCGGYDLMSAEQLGQVGSGKVESQWPAGSALDPTVMLHNHLEGQTWDPMLDYQMMSRNVRGFMSLFHANKPVICKVHGFCVAGGTDLALCSDLLVIAADAKIGYPPARVWGSPTTALWAYKIGLDRAKRLLFTGDCLSGEEAVAWGLAVECAPPSELDERFERLLSRVALLPANQLILAKLLLNQTVSSSLQSSQVLGTLLDGVARHTKEGHGFVHRMLEQGFRKAVESRDGPFGDSGARHSGVTTR